MDADLEKRARELLAAEYEADGHDYVARCIRWDADLTTSERREVRAVIAALSAGQADVSQQTAQDARRPAPRNRREAAALAGTALAYLGVIEAHIDAAIARCETDAAIAASGERDE